MSTIVEFFKKHGALEQVLKAKRKGTEEIVVIGTAYILSVENLQMIIIVRTDGVIKGNCPLNPKEFQDFVYEYCRILFPEVDI